MTGPLLEVTDLTKHYPVRAGVLRRQVGTVHAVDGVSFSVGVGETLGLVGESGCGKSTVARSVLRLVEPTSGQIRLDGDDITHLSKTALRPHRRSMQIVFQDPFASLNPRMTAGDIVGEPLAVHGLATGKALEARTAKLFEQVGLRPDQMRNFPHQFSGGQRQRICIARALALGPRLIVCDEPVSALDVSIQPCRGRPYQPPRRRDVSRPHRRDRRQGRAVPQSAPSLHAGLVGFGTDREPACEEARAAG